MRKLKGMDIEIVLEMDLPGKKQIKPIKPFFNKIKHKGGKKLI